MSPKFRLSLSLGALLLTAALGQGVAQMETTAQTPPIPALPLPSQPVSPGPLPAPEPAPISEPTSEPTPEPAPETPAPEPTPAAPAPAPEPTPTPEPAPTPPPVKAPAAFRGPLLINVETTIPALVNGKKTTVPLTRTLTIPGPRMALIRKSGGVTASLDADLKKFVNGLSGQAQNARFEELWDGWAVVQRNALKIDLVATRANVLAAIKDPQGVKASVVVSGQTPPKQTLDYFVSRGITAHLGTGETNYYGSSDDRVTNIHVGAKNFSDRLFEGKTFSFNQFVGPVNSRNGYVTGLVIAGDRTASGVGGGICQVSTTAFRTLYGAGLPIAQRQNHSYQVHYYDPQGLDATIYQPSLDLKFANDTGGALWFQSEWDDEAASLSISVFGKARDFTVEIGKPKTLSSTPSPADRLISDATLPAGQRKQIDWAAPGAVIEVTRKLVKDGKVLKQDTLKSSYRPWPNIFLVGTGR
ncbi:VanW family protein [Deinococcus arenicola]|uniref:VanW family protein n=1 Tax=Deinococcus arenicola TaxID=2994950 RepID=A0ABU4DM76_9DEIO|nr:VanW family protein [Deinococcus sp. ZS9-10]MDV6373199.1 VanW family protein [Deinococcus sp. ZS9-10]